MDCFSSSPSDNRVYTCVWTKPIWWNHKGKQGPKLGVWNKVEASGLVSLRPLGLFPNNTSGSPTQKPPNRRAAAKPSDQPPSLFLPLAHQNGLLGHFIVLFHPWGGTRGSGGEGALGDKANFVLCGFSVVSESSPTPAAPQASFLSQFYSPVFLLIFLSASFSLRLKQRTD